MILLRKMRISKVPSLKRELKKCFISSNSTSEVIHPEKKEMRPHLEKIKQPPFVKNLFLGIYNKDLLVYPEVLNREVLSELNKMTNLVRIFFSKSVNTNQIDIDGYVPEEITNQLKSMGFFGITVPGEYGGLNLTSTEYARLAEIMGQSPSIFRRLSAHELLGIQSILLMGSKEQKEKYLPKLATGEHVAAFCLTELTSGFNVITLKTYAVYNNDRTELTLNGKKIWVTNGEIADIFIVATKIPAPEMQGEKIGLVIVERNSEGVTTESPSEGLGLRGCNICSVNFKDTPVPVENLLAFPVDDSKSVFDIICSINFGTAAATVGFLKDLFDKTVEYAIQKNVNNHSFIDFQLIQEKLGKMACSIYAIESMIYLTAGILDLVEEPDCNLEISILKSFSSEQTSRFVNECMNVFGGRSYFKNYPYNRFLRDSLAWNVTEGTAEMYKAFIGISGCSYAGTHLADDIRKYRNSLFNPLFIIRKILKKLQIDRNQISLDMDIAGHLHPSLKLSADFLERAVVKLQNAVEVILTRYGPDTTNEQVDLKRLGDIATELYAMTACLGRASRSYCIGLQHAEIEVDMANTYCMDANERINKLYDKLKGELAEVDVNYQQIACRLFEYKGYVIEDPMKYNW